MVALFNIEVDGKLYVAGDILPKLDKWNEDWLVKEGFARAETKAISKQKPKQEKKADDVKGSNKR